MMALVRQDDEHKTRGMVTFFLRVTPRRSRTDGEGGASRQRAGLVRNFSTMWSEHYLREARLVVTDTYTWMTW